jgi:hypothetical protein
MASVKRSLLRDYVGEDEVRVKAQTKRASCCLHISGAMVRARTVWRFKPDFFRVENRLRIVAAKALET